MDNLEKRINASIAALFQENELLRRNCEMLKADGASELEQLRNENAELRERLEDQKVFIKDILPSEDLMFVNEELRKDGKKMLFEIRDLKVTGKMRLNEILVGKVELDKMRGSKDKVIKRFKKHLKKKDAKITKLRLIVETQLAFIKDKEKPKKSITEMIANVNKPKQVWELPNTIRPNSTYCKVELPDGRRAWQVCAVHYGASETTIEYYYLTPGGHDMETDMYSKNWERRIISCKELLECF